MRLPHALLLATLAASAACSRDTTPPPPVAWRPGLGDIMVQVARRFEIAGRAATANRFELAEFEVGEIAELFENDVPGAELPKEGPTAHIPAMAKAFLQTEPPALEKAAQAKDEKAFADAFAHAAATCNGCHKASDKGFIEVPSAPGRPVPDLDPLPAPPAAPR